MRDRNRAQTTIIRLAPMLPSDSAGIAAETLSMTRDESMPSRTSREHRRRSEERENGTLAATRLAAP